MRLAVLACFLVAFLFSFGQSKFSLQPLGGINAVTKGTNTITNPLSDGATHNYPIGVSGGVEIVYQRIKKFAFSSGLFIEQYTRKYKDAKFYSPDGSLLEIGSGSNMISYLVVPFLMQYTKGTEIKIVFEAGGFAGILLQSKTLGTSMTSSGQIIRTKSQETNGPLNLGLSFGTGLLVPLNNKLSFVFKVRDNLGLRNLYESDNAKWKLKTNSLNILGGINYQL